MLFAGELAAAFRGTQIPAQSGLHGHLLWDELSLALSDPQCQLSVSPLLLQHGLLARLLLPLRLQLQLHLLLTNTPAETLVTKQICCSIKVSLLKACSHQHKCWWHLQNMLSNSYSDMFWIHNGYAYQSTPNIRVQRQDSRFWILPLQQGAAPKECINIFTRVMKLAIMILEIIIWKDLCCLPQTHKAK